jgi:Ice-binding-like/Bacterial Ig-like domain
MEITRKSISTAGAAVLALVLASACGPGSSGSDGGNGGNGGSGGSGGGSGGGAGLTAPTVLSNLPSSSATNVRLNSNVSATFSLPMTASSLTASTFTLKNGAAPIAGTVGYANSRAVFTPTAPLPSNAVLTATVTAGAQSATGVHLATSHVWSFNTSTGSVQEPIVPLGVAGTFVILAKSGISVVPTSVLTGNLGVSPAAASYITGLSLVADSTNAFSTSNQVTGQVFAADDAAPTSSNLTTAVANMETAFTDAAGRAANVTELAAGNIGGLTLTAGVYKWGTGLLIPTHMTFSGSATDVWVLQIAQDLTISNGVRVHLAGGALAKNIFWQVSGGIILGTTVHAEGVMLSQTAISLGTGASINGRLLSQTAVSLDSSTVVQPAQ